MLGRAPGRRLGTASSSLDLPEIHETDELCIDWIRENILSCALHPNAAFETDSIPTISTFLADPSHRVLYVYVRDAAVASYTSHPLHGSSVSGGQTPMSFVARSPADSSRGSAMLMSSRLSGSMMGSSLHHHSRRGKLTSDMNGCVDEYKPMIVVSLRSPSVVPNQILYFIRDEFEEDISISNISSRITFGLIRGNLFEAIERSMRTIYIPILTENDAWPESIKKDFATHLYRFMASLTETVHQLHGSTVLYVPEQKLGKYEEVIKDKDLMLLLEAALIGWTRQIREVLNEKDSFDNPESGPLSEIQHWKSRTDDLQGIMLQLSRKDVLAITEVLDRGGSPYLKSFQTLSNTVKVSLIEAEDNLKFLTTLREPCERLADAHPSEIASILPGILYRARLIWEMSSGFNKPDRMIGLLRKISNEIINRCCAYIDLDEVFDGDVLESMKLLRQCIEAGHAWETLFEETADRIYTQANRLDARQLEHPDEFAENRVNFLLHIWDFDRSTIFAEINAFIQRCQDLIEVCEGQMQFASKSVALESETGFPVFGGPRGRDITKSLLDIRASFERHIYALQNLEYDMLDVKSTRWHDDYSVFRKGLKDLEAMLQNVINMAFQAMRSVQEGIELLESFSLLAKRNTIKNTVNLMTIEVFNLFMQDISVVKKEFDGQKKNPPLLPYYPRYAGAAMWAQSLLERALQQWRAIEFSETFLILTDDARSLFDTCRSEFESLRSTIDIHIKNSIYREWQDTIVFDSEELLNNHLIVRVDGPGSLLECNFHESIIRLFQEARYWGKLRMSIPLSAMDLIGREAHFRILRENVMLLVRDYNEILLSLTPEEKRLFAFKIGLIDRKLHHALNKITWTSGVILNYVRDVRTLCRNTFKILLDFKDSNKEIDRLCSMISEVQLVHISPKTVYTKQQYSERQEQCRLDASRILLDAQDHILQLSEKLFDYFRADEDTRVEWAAYVDRLDDKLEAALRSCVRMSLQIIEKHVTGSNIQPLFLVDVGLRSNAAVHFSPDLSDIRDTVLNLASDGITLLRDIVRVHDHLQLRCLREEHERKLEENPNLGPFSMRVENVAKRTSFHRIISLESYTVDTLVAIGASIDSTETAIKKYISQWSEQYQRVWQDEQGPYLRRFASKSPALEDFESEISKYHAHQENVTQHKTTEPLGFLKVDCSNLKQAIVSLCAQWQSEFFALLNKMARSQLDDLFSYFKNHSESLQKTPADVMALARAEELVGFLESNIDEKQDLYQEITNKYRMLYTFDVPVRDEEKSLLASVPAAFEAFDDTIQTAKVTLAERASELKKRLLHDLDSYGKSVMEFASDFNYSAPYSLKVSANETRTDAIEQAFHTLAHLSVELSKRLSVMEELKFGLNKFEVDQPPYREIEDVQKEIVLLERAWTVARDWDREWLSVKDAVFSNLNVDQLETAVEGHRKKLVALERELKGKSWDVVRQISEDVDRFRKTVPLLQDLKYEGLRDRHWRKIMDRVNNSFNPYGSAFTLEAINKLGLVNHAEFISSLAGQASKEFKIEISLAEIKSAWSSTLIDLIPHREQYLKVSVADELFSDLQDNQATLAAMKMSKFIGSFGGEVEEWEKKLSHIAESLDLLLEVQRQWIHLESIFGASQDMKKHLPNESKRFEYVTEEWMSMMNFMVEDPTALRCTHKEGIIDTLDRMNKGLEMIQKSLDDYLEKKRQAFPRFYFLSSEDLLEILGQSRDPEMVQKHLKKCFEAINRLDIQEKEGGRGLVALGMISPEQEKIDFFPSPVQLDHKAVETWLLEVEARMRTTVRQKLQVCLKDTKSLRKKEDFPKWLSVHSGQSLITASQIVWTSQVEKALAECDSKDSLKPLQDLRKYYYKKLNLYAEMVRGKLTSLDRKKLVALITIEVHARDVISDLYNKKVKHTKEFEWASQLKFYWEEKQLASGLSEGTSSQPSSSVAAAAVAAMGAAKLSSGRETEDRCVVRQTSATLLYDNEYLGNSGRLVITPLTDRCYMTLTSALELKRGGNPQGPAGTGKTETVKDLGKAIAKYVIVFNCSDQLDIDSLGRMFSGLAQTGAWSCFDEFNRIEVEVLSVVAQQILCILNAIIRGESKFLFNKQMIKLNPACGIFVTMNPGYAGRSELPDNLKALLRPISMMVPDSILIAEIMLQAEGFTDSKNLSRKIVTLYQLMTQQLSKQDHYDFGLRAIKSVLNSAGALKRSQPEENEQALLLQSCRDMNLSKFVAEDVPLFLAMLGDLFPGISLPNIDRGELEEAIRDELVRLRCDPTPHMIDKCLQLHDTKATRHGNMLVGLTGSGKTTCWQTLSAAKTQLAKEGIRGYERVNAFIINPKCCLLYGEYNPITTDMTDGVLSKTMREACADEKSDEKWLVLDGPVDTLWIESMNTVLDDNKMLTLTSGERIQMNDQVSLLFEVQDLAVASPATVSRCGMVYFDVSDMGILPFFHRWLRTRDYGDLNAAAVIDQLTSLFDRFVPKCLELRKRSGDEIVPITDLNGLQSLTRLFDSLATPENGVTSTKESDVSGLIEMWFIFSVIWSLGASLGSQGRKEFDLMMREIDSQFPSTDTVYEYFVDHSSKQWKQWLEKIPQNWTPNLNLPFYKLFVPTVDTVRNSFVVSALARARQPILLVGATGTGKTAIVQSLLDSLDDSKFGKLLVNLSAQTTYERVQKAVEMRIERRIKGVYAPPGGKKLIAFLDDLNMPRKDEYGSQPPLELLRQWMEHGFWYDIDQQFMKKVQEMQVVSAMGPPGGGRTVISQRLQSKFNLVNVTFPSPSQVRHIFSSMLKHKLMEFMDEIRQLVDPIVIATVEIYNEISRKLLPTPTRSHYVFNLRDLSKIFQGLLSVSKESFESRESYIRLWIHECLRVFGDRLVDSRDEDYFRKLLDDMLFSHFETKWSSVCEGGNPPLFGDFNEPPVDESVYDVAYQEIPSFDLLRNRLAEILEDYNARPKIRPMSLVLFKEAMEHVCRIRRVIRHPRGNVMLVGVGGSGRQSLARLAAWIGSYDVFQIEVTKGFNMTEWRKRIAELYEMVGSAESRGRHVVFLFTDTQIVDEGFLEDINNILSSGDVPNLFDNDTMNRIREEMRPLAQAENRTLTPDGLYQFFIDRVRDHLHLVLCMSPVGESFRNYIRAFPSLVSCTTIDWFSDWPADALYEVAQRYTEDIEFSEENASEMRNSLSKVMVRAHVSVSEMNVRMLNEIRRPNYVTPTNFLELLGGYKKLLLEKTRELRSASSKLRNGLSKLEAGRIQVEHMSKILAVKQIEVEENQRACDVLMKKVWSEKAEADEREKQVASEAARIAKEKEIALNEMRVAEGELERALPALEEAEGALGGLSRSDMIEVRSYQRFPKEVQYVLEAVMALLGKPANLDTAKKEMANPGFLSQLITFDKDNMKLTVLNKLASYTSRPEFQPERVAQVSGAAFSMCKWVRAMEVYGNIAKTVNPKRARVRAAMEDVRSKEENLQRSQDELAHIQAMVADLKAQHQEATLRSERLRQEAEVLAESLRIAEQLVDGLSGERERWAKNADLFDDRAKRLVGDVYVASAFMAYAGPFTSEYRLDLVYKWMDAVRDENMPFSEDFNFMEFLARPTDVREWNIRGLPTDSFSIENGVVVTRSERWPLMVDPQGQANKWIKRMMGEELRVTDFKKPDFLRTLENAIEYGGKVLLEDVEQDLDPSIEPILARAIVKLPGNRFVIKVGDKELEWNEDFRLFLTTKLPNPHYPPEVCTKTTIVNFGVKQQGLEDQLLGIVVRKERIDLETSKDALVVEMAQAKRTLENLEDEILHLLETSEDLIQDRELVKSLNTAKETSQRITEQIRINTETQVKIDSARNEYRPCAKRAAILFFVLNDLNVIDPMYQFALDAYIRLFELNISSCPHHEDVKRRIVLLNNFHTMSVYNSTCRGLFEKHKLLFAFQICVKILEGAGTLSPEDFQFFLKGGQVLEKETQPPNPCPGWMTEQAWDNIFELDKLHDFRGIAESFEQLSRDWHEWYMHPEPETMPFKGEWEAKLNDRMKRMVLVRCLRVDRVQFMVRDFIKEKLGEEYTRPPVPELDKIFEESSCRVPLVFVLSPGVDPTTKLQELASSRGIRFEPLALGRGQGDNAMSMLERGIYEGTWVFLANCHLMISWLPTLEKYLNDLEDRQVHPDFRLWLSSAPHPKFPIGILQRSIKITTEPPKGLRNNMIRLYNLISEDKFESCDREMEFKRLLFSLCFYHSVLLERRKFGSLGLNIPYDFNDSDFEVSVDILQSYLSDAPPNEVPWKSLRYLIAEASYGGRVTDHCDRRIINVYMDQFFHEDAIETDKYRLSSLSSYLIPSELHLEAFKSFVRNELPDQDRPEAFGQHANADISSQIEDSTSLLDTLLSLQPRSAPGSSSTTPEEIVLGLADDLEAKVPEDIDYEMTRIGLPDDGSALNQVLLQEIARYNILLRAIKNDLYDLKRGIRGLVVMSPELDEVFTSILDGKVPQAWQRTYPSLKPLASWMRDLIARIEQLRRWSLTSTPPKVFWLGGFTFPTGFLKALQQNYARQHHVSVDTLSWEFIVLEQAENDIIHAPKDGAYIRGMILEGAGWDEEAEAGGQLCEPKPMELLVSMPIVWFRPVDARKKRAANLYECPLYFYPVRTGSRERPSFMLFVDLRSGEYDPDHWVKRGTALLLSTV